MGGLVRDIGRRDLIAWRPFTPDRAPVPRSECRIDPPSTILPTTATRHNI